MNGKRKRLFQKYQELSEVWEFGKEPKEQMNIIFKRYLWTEYKFSFLTTKVQKINKHNNQFLGKKRLTNVKIEPNAIIKEEKNNECHFINKKEINKEKKVRKTIGITGNTN